MRVIAAPLWLIGQSSFALFMLSIIAFMVAVGNVFGQFLPASAWLSGTIFASPVGLIAVVGVLSAGLAGLSMISFALYRKITHCEPAILVDELLCL